jgi:hypothetical protein
MTGDPRSFQSNLRDWSQIRGRRLLAICCLLISLSTLLAVAGESAAPQQSGVRDFAAYWASARLLLASQNPYSPPELLALQRKLGWQDVTPLVMWNPPWTFAVTLPFGLLDFAFGQFLWLMFHISLVLLSGKLLWRMYGDSSGHDRLAWVLTVTFVPTVFVLIIGQIAPLVLAGLTGFLYFESRGKQFAAGAWLALALVKPHFIYLFWIVFALWVIGRNERAMLAGLAVAGITAAALPLIINPLVYAQYIDLFRPTDLRLPLDLPAPTLRNAVKLLLEVDVGAWETLPSLLAVAWVLFYWWRHRADWRWSERLPLVLIVSLTASAYTWTFDQVVFLPAIVQVAGWLVRRRLPWYTSFAALLYIAIDLAHAALRVFLADELWYFWLAPALLVNYLVFRWESSRV